jgi:hypothetical protein
MNPERKKGRAARREDMSQEKVTKKNPSLLVRKGRPSFRLINAMIAKKASPRVAGATNERNTLRPSPSAREKIPSSTRKEEIRTATMERIRNKER